MAIGSLRMLCYRLALHPYPRAFMPYEDPLEAALRSLTDVEWTKRRDRFEARINATHLEGIQLMLADYHIIVEGEVSAQRSGRYIATISMDQTPKIHKAVAATKAVVKPHRRKWHS